MDDCGGEAVDLPDHELRRAGDLVGDGDLRRVEVTRRAYRPSRSRTAPMPATLSATSVVPSATHDRTSPTRERRPRLRGAREAAPEGSPPTYPGRAGGGRACPCPSRSRRPPRPGADEAVTRLGHDEWRPRLQISRASRRTSSVRRASTSPARSRAPARSKGSRRSS